MQLIHVDKREFSPDNHCHTVKFIFEQDIYEAFIVETPDSTSVAQIYNAETGQQIHIPEHFGCGYASKIFSFLYTVIDQTL